jgi:Protein of unknown function (DUF3828)
MRKIITVVLFITTGLIACKDKKEASTKENAGRDTTVTIPKNEEIAANPAEDSAAIRKVITDFYNWYNTSYNRLFEYKLYSGIKKTDAPPYKINWVEVETYQKFMRSDAPQLGEEFFTRQKQFLQECDSAFKVNTEDEIPYGFDYDWYTNSQDDAQYLVDEVNKKRPWPISFSGDYATVDVIGAYDDNGKQKESSILTLKLKKENGQWKIARIGNN